ncbi:UDP-N-acetylglucosamine 2-epimerase (non-hydrolyzing) [Corynebacterium sp. 13CS0277]|uniref:non-hydrolyzing UDP-N-acetylglucosamine 2-epimerase n=1 Tax=Corynebacterium sp. 13CS0277 TaxID=2071994 RepID=UPI000D032A59|nr:UDP-N-acetylglucosamine 2-epimerase (non-hydrolyzing) [Corynebacterium sp. 13CS0277]PRQ10486.1 UDP-N-acetylglucosamine 2-epimerase (non-hydrolyzing) [Corynebacterium sp. 13CS0277]
MSQAKIMTVYGTRPEAIKVAPFISAALKDPRFEMIVVSTGQHREMLAQVNEMFGITPDYDLDIMEQGQTLNMVVGKVVKGLDEILEKEQPDVVIAQGDTTTAMAAAIASFNRGVRVAHLEAGLRTGNIQSPFPEEANRRLICQVTSLHLAPTQDAKANLLREAIPECDVVVTGNTVIEALLQAQTWDTEFVDERLVALNADSPIIMVTTHRRENLNAMASIGRAMRVLALEFPDTILVLPAHLNPAVRSAVFPQIKGLNNVIVTEPLPYDQFTKLMAMSTIVLTDSGGVQEEAPSLGKPVLVMRENTERPEAIAAGTVKLVGTNEDKIVEEVSRLLNDEAEYAKMANAVNPYGDGEATRRILNALAEMFGLGTRSPDFVAR